MLEIQQKLGKGKDEAAKPCLDHCRHGLGHIVMEAAPV